MRGVAPWIEFHIAGGVVRAVVISKIPISHARLFRRLNGARFHGPGVADSYATGSLPLASGERSRPVVPIGGGNALGCVRFIRSVHLGPVPKRT